MFSAKDLSVGIVAIILGIVIITQSQGLVAKTSLDPAGPSALPLLMAWAMIVLGAIHIVGGIVAKRANKDAKPREGIGAILTSFLSRYRLVMLVALEGAAFIALLNFLGYLIALPLMTAAILWTLGNRNLKTLIGTNLALTAILFVLFHFALTVDFPLGPFTGLF
ncbi:MAG TPA: tripartite tricarboxylate transporter TctB family protein [Rectinemataceae bacterium]|nr:tripartite tricarboxylate transporter TctB family protein [Rectinemataceae bacterium]